MEVHCLRRLRGSYRSQGLAEAQEKDENRFSQWATHLQQARAFSFALGETVAKGRRPVSAAMDCGATILRIG